jgi:hypothetical protein
MPEWWTYTLTDFLMFSPQVYFRQFELHNRALWPAQLLTLGVGAAILLALLRRDEKQLRLLVAVLGGLWIWISWAFFWDRYAMINWGAVYVAPFVAAEGVLLIWIGLARGRLALPATADAPRRAAIGLFAAALALYPFVAPLSGRSWLSAEVFGIAPDPTAVATLALLAVTRGRSRWLSMPIPLLWCMLSAATLWTMEAGGFFLPIAGALASVALAMARGRSAAAFPV